MATPKNLFRVPCMTIQVAIPSTQQDKAKIVTHERAQTHKAFNFSINIFYRPEWIKCLNGGSKDEIERITLSYDATVLTTC